MRFLQHMQAAPVHREGEEDTHHEEALMAREVGMEPHRDRHHRALAEEEGMAQGVAILGVEEVAFQWMA